MRAPRDEHEWAEWQAEEVEAMQPRRTPCERDEPPAAARATPTARGTLDQMDTLAILRGIIHGAADRMLTSMDSPDVPVPISVLCRAADEIAIARDRMLRACMMPADDSPSVSASQKAIPDGSGSS